MVGGRSYFDRCKRECSGHDRLVFTDAVKAGRKAGRVRIHEVQRCKGPCQCYRADYCPGVEIRGRFNIICVARHTGYADGNQMVGGRPYFDRGKRNQIGQDGGLGDAQNAVGLSGKIAFQPIRIISGNGKIIGDSNNETRDGDGVCISDVCYGCVGLAGSTVV